MEGGKSLAVSFSLQINKSKEERIASPWESEGKLIQGVYSGNKTQQASWFKIFTHSSEKKKIALEVVISFSFFFFF